MADTVDNILKRTLEGLGVPCERLKFSGTADTFIVFQLVLGQEIDFSDDGTNAMEYIYQIHLYSKGDYIPLLQKAKKALKEAGFFNVTINPEIFESETGFYHIPLEVNYLEV